MTSVHQAVARPGNNVSYLACVGFLVCKVSRQEAYTSAQSLRSMVLSKAASLTIRRDTAAPGPFKNVSIGIGDVRLCLAEFDARLTLSIDVTRPRVAAFQPE